MREKTVIKPESEKKTRFEKLRPAQGRRKRSWPTVNKDRTLLLTLRKQSEPRRGELEDLVSDTLPAGYEMRRYWSELAVSTISNRNRGLPPTFREDAFESRTFTLVFLL